VIPKDIQKNKLNGLPIHVDFMRLTKGAKIVLEIPVTFLNEETCIGLKAGGTLNVVRYAVELSVLPDNIPESIEIDLASFDVGDSVHISAAVLPEGAEPTITDRDFTVATIIAPGGASEEEEEEAAQRQQLQRLRAKVTLRQRAETPLKPLKSKPLGVFLTL